MLRGRTPDLVIVGRRVVTPSGTRPAAVAIRNGVIIGLMRPDEAPRGDQVYDAGDAVVMPGIIDMNVHVNEPGRQDWEGFDTATRGAAAGGVTTIVDMPFHGTPAATNPDALRLRRNLAESRCWVDVGFWAGLVRGNLGSARRLVDAGALGFKCCLVPCGSDDFPAVGAGDLRVALPVLRDLGALLLVHAELPQPIEKAWAALAAEGADARLYANYLRARPAAAENEAVELLLALCEEFGAAIHLTHYSSTDTLRALQQARAAGVPITVETAPHYLHFAAEDIPDGATEFKCTPPIRAAAHREALWDALGDGIIDSIASDHSPAPAQLKNRERGDFASAWPGIGALQLTLPVVWSGARVRGFSPWHIANWLCMTPARLAGIADRKGSLAPGLDADITIWDTEAESTVAAAALQHRNKLTPYEGQSLYGTVRATYLRGERVYDGGSIIGKPRGALLKKRMT